MAAIEYINRVVAARDGLDLLFITGDMTSSAELTQYKKAHQLLNNLTVKWYPVTGKAACDLAQIKLNRLRCEGNHDMWPYANTYEAPSPIGDAYFAAEFQDILQNPNDTRIVAYNAQPVHNPVNNCTSWFQNYEVYIAGEDVTFLALDYNTRDHAILGYKGALQLPTSRWHICVHYHYH